MSDTATANIRVSEIFGPTIQGEGQLIGLPTVFVRSGGCDFRCDWCDTLYAVEPQFKPQWTPMSAKQVMQKITELAAKPLLVTLSGGNPALQPFAPLIELGHSAGFTFSIETQGSIAQDWFGLLDFLVLSPKPPSSGMSNDWSKVDRCIEQATHADISFKIVVQDDADFEFARAVGRRYAKFPLSLQACNPQPDSNSSIEQILQRQRWLTEKVCAEKWYDVRVLPQLHALLWGNQRGV
jgi:7-carboxy-7-deazaguanine synthase